MMKKAIRLAYEQDTFWQRLWRAYCDCVAIPVGTGAVLSVLFIAAATLAGWR